MYDEHDVSRSRSRSPSPVNYASIKDDAGAGGGDKDGYVGFSELQPKKGGACGGWTKVLAAGLLIAGVMAAIFMVASGALGNLFPGAFGALGLDGMGGPGSGPCVGPPEECDLRQVVQSFCPAKIPCTFSDDCGPSKECFDIKTATLGVECKAGECFCEENICGLSQDGKTLNLGGIAIYAKGSVRLAKPLMHDKTVEDVRLWETEIGDDGIEVMSDAVANHVTIKSLNLAGNGFTDKSAVFLSSMMAKNEHIVEMNLSDNGIANEGAKELAEGLRQNSAMRVLNLWQNKIGEQGALYMAEAFDFNLDLRKLYLTDNNIDAGGVGSKALSVASDSRDNLTITFEANDRRLGD